MNRFESNMERNLLLLKAAKWMLEENTITNRWEITSEFVISRSERNSNKVPQIINRHINKFKKQHQNFTNSKHEQRRLKEIIAEQDTALKTLWQEIQKVKISTQN